MFGSTILDTAIGLVFVFLLVSLLVTVVNELIAAFLFSRAKCLRDGVRRLLDVETAARLYAHPLIAGTSIPGIGPSYIPSANFASALLDVIGRSDRTALYAKLVLQKALDGISTATGTVADLKAALTKAAEEVAGSAALTDKVRTELGTLHHSLAGENPDLAAFATMLKDVAAKVPPSEMLFVVRIKLAAMIRRLEHSQSSYTVAQVASDLRYAMEAIPVMGESAAMISTDQQRLLEQIPDQGGTVESAKKAAQAFIDGIAGKYLRCVIAQTPSDHVRRALMTLLDDAQGNVDTFKANIEAWFNNGMDRVAGWYKRKTQWVVGALSLTMVLVLNVDSLAILQTLNTQPGVRDALVAQAKAFADRPPVTIVNSAPAVAPLSGSAPAPGGATQTVVVPPKADSKPGTPAADGGPSAADQIARYEAIQSQLSQLNLPIGWFRSPAKDDKGKSKDGADSNTKDNKDDRTKKDGVDAGAKDGKQDSKVKPGTAVDKIAVAVEQTSQFQVVNHLMLPDSLADAWSTLLFHLPGWLLTALAVSLGAPFWFDMLNKIMSIRSSGKSPMEALKLKNEAANAKPPKQEPA